MCSRGIIEATTLSFYMNGKSKRVVEACVIVAMNTFLTNTF